jgi:hypothetical protein
MFMPPCVPVPDLLCHNFVPTLHAPVVWKACRAALAPAAAAAASVLCAPAALLCPMSDLSTASIRAGSDSSCCRASPAGFSPVASPSPGFSSAAPAGLNPEVEAGGGVDCGAGAWPLFMLKASMACMAVCCADSGAAAAVAAVEP